MILFLQVFVARLEATSFSWDTMDYQHQKHVFIIASGRSGSTSILWMLNQIPGYDLKGETNGKLGHQIYQTYTVFTEEHAAIEKTLSDAFIHSNKMDHHLLKHALGELFMAFENFNKNATTVGYKELAERLGPNMTIAELYLDIFPNAKFVLNFRENATAQLQSQFWKKRDVGYFEKITSSLKSFNQRHPKQTFVLLKEEITAQKFNELFEWLGEPCNCSEILRLNDAGGYTDQSIVPKVVHCHHP